MEIEKSPQSPQPPQPSPSPIISKNDHSDWKKLMEKCQQFGLNWVVSYIAKVTIMGDSIKKDFYSSDDKSSFLPDTVARNLASKFAFEQMDWNSIQKQKAQYYGAPTNPKYEFDEICKLPKFSGIILEHETIKNKIQKSFHASGKLSGPKSRKFIDKSVVDNDKIALFTVEFKTTKGYPDKASAERKVAQTLLRFASVYNDQVWEAYKKLTPEQQLFRIGEKVEFGEDEKTEFKGKYSSLVLDDVFFHVDNFLIRIACSFMNTKGGSLFIGINDDQKVPGCILTLDDQDEIRLRCFQKLKYGLNTTDWTNHVNVTFHPVIAANRSDLFVVEVIVTKATQTQLTTDGEQYIRWGASTTTLTTSSAVPIEQHISDDLSKLFAIQEQLIQQQQQVAIDIRKLLGKANTKSLQTPKAIQNPKSNVVSLTFQPQLQESMTNNTKALKSETTEPQSDSTSQNFPLNDAKQSPQSKITNQVSTKSKQNAKPKQSPTEITNIISQPKQPTMPNNLTKQTEPKQKAKTPTPNDHNNTTTKNDETTKSSKSNVPQPTKPKKPNPPKK